jgi:hypothetical protein
MIQESSQKEIIVSKIIVGILTLYVVYWIGINLSSNGQYATLHFKNKDYFSGIFSSILCIAILIFQIAVLTQILKNKTSKHKFTNFKRNFHPFFKDENQDDLLFKYILISIGSFILWFIFPLILDYFSKDDLGYNPSTLFAVYAHFGILYAVSARNNTLDKLPVKLMKTNKITLILPYEDYINKKIIDDEPHLKLNQSFEFKIKNLPRNESEKNTIEIRNNNTPINSALITKIEDWGLANAIRNGNAIKSRLVSIGEFAKLEIELSLENAL